ncbi:MULTISPECIES: BACON domain-containing protein [unclassified Carboxylicivirga]|uniref:BACON domain-containing protein n=1 Tax=Carboxylicivirga TaxID=1628153 RepID=UPI003D339BAA
MKKGLFKALSYLLVVTGLLVVACNEDIEEQRIPYFSATAEYFTDETTLQVGVDSMEINIETNSYWEIQLDEEVDWVSVTPQKGTGDNVASVELTPNTSVYERSAYVYFNAYELNDSIKIQQAGSIIALSESSLTDVPWNGEEISINLASAVKWKSEQSETGTWINVEPQKGDDGTTEIILMIDENDNKSARLDSVLFISATEDDLSKVWLKVAQNGNENAGKSIILSQSKVEKIDAAGLTHTIELTAIKNWKSSQSATGNWITAKPGNGEAGKTSVDIIIAENTSTEVRTDSILFNDNEAAYNVWFKVSQEAFEPLIEATTSIDQVSSESGSLTIELSSNVDWEASCEIEGVLFEPANGIKSNEKQNIKVTYPKNSETDARNIELNIIGISPYNDIVQTITIAQQGSEGPSFEVEKENISIDGSNQDFEIQLNLAVEAWEAVSSNSKFRIIENESGNASTTPIVIKVNAADNKSLSNVEGIIEIRSVANPDNKIEVNISQGLHPMNDETLVYTIPSQKANELGLDRGVNHPTKEGWKFWNANEFENGQSMDCFWNFNTANGIKNATFNKDLKIRTAEGTLKLKTIKLTEETTNQHGEPAFFETGAAIYSKRHHQGGDKWVKFTENMRVEVRFKNSGIHGFNEAIWFMGQTNYDSYKINWPDCGELDLVEMPFPNEAHCSLHTQNFSSNTGNAETAHVTLADETKWNIYWIEVLEDRIIGGVNGHQYFEHIKGEGGNNDWPWDHPSGMMLIVTPGIGAWSGVMPNMTAGQEANMELDWIRVYVNDQFDESSQDGHNAKYY